MTCPNYKIENDLEYRPSNITLWMMSGIAVLAMAATTAAVVMIWD